jgi:hypothetical protein
VPEQARAAGPGGGVDFTVRVYGGRELRRALKKAGADMRQLTDAHRAASSIVAAEAAARAPRRSGALAGSVRAQATRTRGRVAVGGAAIPYAGPIHWGWPARHIAPSLFVTEAAAVTEPTWVERYEQGIAEIVQKVNDAT